MSWTTIRDQAISDFEAADVGEETPHAYAYILGAIARSSPSAWLDPRIEYYEDKLITLRNTDGGWGLNEEWDAFQNGTINPEDTTYTVTLADHVGPVILAGVQVGRFPASLLQDIVDLLMSTNSVTYTTIGRGIAYSRSPNDTIQKVGTVHNVSALAASFLWQAHLAGYTAPGLEERVAEVIRMEVYYWNWKLGTWPYKNDTGVTDTDHLAAQTEAMYTLTPAVGVKVARQILTEGRVDKPSATIAHARLTGMWGSPQFLNTWLSEAQNYINNPPGNRERAQIAYWAARNAELEAL